MMGELVGQQDRLFYEFDLEERVPADHLLRRLERFRFFLSQTCFC